MPTPPTDPPALTDSPTPAKGLTSWVDDATLAARLASDQEQALDQLLERYWVPLFRYARRLLDDADLAEDVTQEGFLRLWERRHRLDPTAVRALLYRTVHNLAIDELRRRRRHTAWVRSIPPAVEPPPATPLPSQPVPPAEEAIAYAIDALPARRRQAFVLAHLHRMSYREAAAVMGVSVATVKNQVAAALATLRMVIGDWAGGNRE